MFHPRDGWNVLVDIDAMERAKGDQQQPDKKERVEIAEKAIVDAGVSIGVHPGMGSNLRLTLGTNDKTRMSK